jgi:hypothetical protein
MTRLCHGATGADEGTFDHTLMCCILLEKSWPLAGFFLAGGRAAWGGNTALGCLPTVVLSHSPTTSCYRAAYFACFHAEAPSGAARWPGA